MSTPSDNIWIADGLAKSGKAGDVVRKYDQNGKLLRTLGELTSPAPTPAISTPSPT